MRLTPIDSDALDGAAYDARRRTLTVRFTDGGTYEYYDVDPELFERMLRAQPHPWAAVSAEVKRHRYRRLD
jgi:hypothetical protein